MSRTLDLVLEVGCEELPDDLLYGAIEELGQKLKVVLQSNRLAPEQVVAYGTPRRLVAIARGIPAKQPSVTETVTGPPKRAAVDAQGTPTKAGQGFARSQGVGFADLMEVETEKGTYLGIRKTRPGRAASTVLREALPGVLGMLSWAKAMRWGRNLGPFARPVRWICAVAGAKAVPFEFAGVKAGNRSRGHRFLAPKPFAVRSADDYLAQMAARHVVLDPAERAGRIAAALDKAAREAGGRAVADPDLVAVTAAKTEWPVAVVGRFDEKYLELPREVLVTSMREHQDDFAVEGPDGKLLPAFVAFADHEAPDMALVARGNERVLRARLEDARFFFKEDLQRPLEAYAPRLDSFLFQEKLGSVGDKARRVTALARELAAPLGADPDLAARAGALCKCDLVTGMVYEFPELQGVMGRIYAQASGEKEAVAGAIAEHYRPLSAMGDLPRTPEGRAVALADKLDTICGIYGIGLVPSGSQDPYALRRAGAGVVRMLALAPTGIDLNTLPDRAIRQLGDRLAGAAPDLAEKVALFLQDRLIFALEQEGLRPDVVRATVNADVGDAHDTAERARALDALTRAAGFDDLMTGCKRIVRIIPDGFAPAPVVPDRLQTGPERDLWDAFATAQRSIRDRTLPAGERLAALSGLRPQVDAFFDAVLVMDPDEGVRRQRLSMLAEIRETFRTFADFGQVAVG